MVGRGRDRADGGGDGDNARYRQVPPIPLDGAL
jgi:hypothetical protein